MPDASLAGSLPSACPAGRFRRPGCFSGTNVGPDHLRETQVVCRHAFTGRENRPE
jgi:hypothetical protein